MGLFGWKKNAVPVETNEPEIKDKNIPNKSLIVKEREDSQEFDLNIEKILENWEVYHALREIIANALD